MIQLTRSLCRQLRVVLKKAFGRMKPDVRVTAGPGGLRIQAKGFQHAVEYFDPEPREAAELVVPFAVLQDVQGNKQEPVRLYCPKKNVLTAIWDDRRIERSMEYPLPKDDGTKFHDGPQSFSENPPALLRALADAQACTDPTSTRYALGCIQLRGQSGQLAATDGRQLLLQSGYTFGFPDEVLVHSSDVFDCAELPQDQPVFIGKTNTHVVVRVGLWSFYLALGEGRFPHVDTILPSIQSASTTLELHPADAEFLAENISRLPMSTEDRSITLDLNGTVAVRGKTGDAQAAELILTNSSKRGDGFAICLNRLNVQRAAEMGFDRLYLYGDRNAVLARDEHRSYLFMPFDPEQAIKPSDDCLKIPSPISTRSSFSPRTHALSAPMTTNHINPAQSSPATTAGHGSSNPSTEQPVRRRRRTGKSGPGVLEQAVAVRDQLRTTLTSVKDLIRTLKAERRSQKSLKLALDSLKQLQAAA